MLLVFLAKPFLDHIEVTILTRFKPRFLLSRKRSKKMKLSWWKYSNRVLCGQNVVKQHLLQLILIQQAYTLHQALELADYNIQCAVSPQ
jgi:hypothetical protein